MTTKDAGICIHKNNRVGRTKGILFVLLILIPILFVSCASGAVPVPSFSANITTGPAPLTVNFTDLSQTTPTAWAWYFGDENLSTAWTFRQGPASWSARQSQSTVVTPNGSIVLMGGTASNGASPTNDTWLSPDRGFTWNQMSASSGWLPRGLMTSVMMPDSSIVMMGGLNGSTVLNDTWRSTNNGTSWTIMNASSGWSARKELTSVSLSDGSIVLMGGANTSGSPAKNDTWRSTNNGASWTLMNASSGWLQRYGHTSVALPDGSIVLMGGSLTSGASFRNDTWRSTDKGASWTLMNASSGWPARYQATSVAIPDGSIILMGGLDSNFIELNDTWRSADKGATWTKLSGVVDWTPRNQLSSNVLPDGSIVLMGGADAGGPTNDVYLLATAASSARNPTHVYTANGLYQVALQVTNASGYNSTRVAGFINVANAGVPVANFSATPTSGTAPLTVTFSDLSTNTPTSWNWSFGDGNVTNATVQNPIHTYLAPGTYSVSLNVTNSQGFNNVTKNGYIIVASSLSVTNITPASGINTTFVTIRNLVGTGFATGATVQLNRTGVAGFITASNLTVDNSTRINCTIDLTGLQTGRYNVIVTNLDGNQSMLANGFLVRGGATVTGIFRPSNAANPNGGNWYLDMNGNGTWDPATDKTFQWGKLIGDIPVSGDWNGDGITETGIFRPSTASNPNGGNWYLDMNGNGTWDPATDMTFQWGKLIGDVPVTGDWNGDGITETGIFRPSNAANPNGGNWYLDMNANGVWDPATDMTFQWGKFIGDLPVTGDWNGDGITETGIFRPSNAANPNGGNWYLDMNANGVWDPLTDMTFQWGKFIGDLPVSGDWNTDGITETGIFRPSNAANPNGGNWYLDMNANGVWDPLTDMTFQWGKFIGDLPVTGMWG